MKYAVNYELRMFCDVLIFLSDILSFRKAQINYAQASDQIIDSLHLLAIISCWWEVVVQVVVTKAHVDFVIFGKLHIGAEKSYKQPIVRNLFNEYRL